MPQHVRYPSLTDRVVYITGGADGTGGNMVSLLAARGAKVAFLDINADLANKNVEWCAEQGYAHWPLFLKGDVRDIARLEETKEFNRMVLFLAADDGWACTSQSYIVDAGRGGL